MHLSALAFEQREFNNFCVRRTTESLRERETGGGGGGGGAGRGDAKIKVFANRLVKPNYHTTDFILTSVE